MRELDTIELFVDEENQFSGVEAISLVENPAIEENFVALKAHKVEFKTINEDKRIIVGLALVPNKKIYRKSGDYEYNIMFSEDTVKKVAELYMKRQKNLNVTVEHEEAVDGVSVIESWIVEDPNQDKTNLYNLNAVKGAWAVMMKVDNDEEWRKVKNGEYLGLSIEGFFKDAVIEASKAFTEAEADEYEALAKLFDMDDLMLSSYGYKLESYSDYPEAAKNNAKRALKWAEENGWGSCGTPVGKRRASQLAKGEGLSRSTIARMAAFKRHQQNKDVPYSEGCGGLMWDSWGGSAGVNWAIAKIKEIDGK
jgi:hypothetical protein